MKNIKTFESFSLEYPRVNETADMFMMPVDPIRGAAEVYKSIGDVVKRKFSEIVGSLQKTPASDVAKIKNFMLKTFGTTTPEFSRENAEKLQLVLGLDSIEEGFKEGEDIVIKIMGVLKNFLGLSAAGWANAPLAALVAGLTGSGIIAGAALIGAFVLLWILTKVMEIFGYDSDDIAATGEYDPSKDIRNKLFGGSTEKPKNTPKPEVNPYIDPSTGQPYKAKVGGIPIYIKRPGQ